MELPSFELVDEDGGLFDGVFEGTFGDFVYSGDYRVVFYARNADGLVTASPPTIVTVTGGLPPGLVGDVDNSGAVDLVDAILALKIAAGLTPEDDVFTWADVNGDGKIGVAEALYALQAVLGLRSGP